MDIDDAPSGRWPDGAMTVACRDEDFVDWHQGCRRAALWAVDADRDDVHAAVGAVRDLYRDLLLPRYERQPHITVAFRGLIPEPHCHPADAFTPVRLDGDLEALRSVRLAPFEVVVGGWGTFPMVPYLSVSGPELLRLQQALVTDPRYTPHVTAGHYRIATSIAGLYAIARDLKLPPPVSFAVERLALMTYDTADIAGPLRVEGTLDLATGEWVRSAPPRPETPVG